MIATYCENLYAAFNVHADQAKALPMQQYMRNQFAFFGLPSPLRKTVFKQFLASYGYPEPEALDAVVKCLWNKPERELQFVAMEMAAHKNFRLPESRINLYEWMITQKSWWDTVDFIAANLVGPWFSQYPQSIAPVTAAWMVSNNIWLQRSALLFQLRYKEKTDRTLLFQYIEQLQGSSEFFITKAIGWSLRELSKTDPESVLQFTAQHDLATLSKREALRIINKKKEL